jgi:hypothetical protein
MSELAARVVFARPNIAALLVMISMTPMEPCMGRRRSGRRLEPGAHLVQRVPHCRHIRGRN